MENFEVQNSVQLLNGLTPTMTISELNADKTQANCVWFDSKTRKVVQQWLPTNSLKHTPKREPIDLSMFRR